MSEIIDNIMLKLPYVYSLRVYLKYSTLLATEKL